LKIIEGTDASVPPQGGRKHPNQEMLKINTRNILFICGGAFVGLDKVIEKRVSSHAMGFGASIINTQDKDLHTLYSKLLPDDLVKFGLIPEFIGRLPIHVALDNLTKNDLMRIILEPKNSIIRQYEASFRLDGIEFVFKSDAVEAVAEKAFEQKTGARGLRSIVENVMMGIMYDIPSIKQVKQVIVGRECVINGEQPEVIRGA
jgi:ATP-dependent Clp protease ATP-binding subunit ClpX